MIRAIVQDGRLKPLEPLPPEWGDGRELIIDESDWAPNPAELEAWEREIAEAAAAIPEEEHDRFEAGLAQIERESKEAVRREWGLP